MKKNKYIVKVTDLEEFKKAYLILNIYAKGIHDTFEPTEERAIRLFSRKNTLILFLNNNSLLGLIDINIFDDYKEINYQTLINEY